MKIQDIIIWILFIISIIIALWYLFGSSPTLEQAILILMLTLLITNIVETREIKTKLGILINSFMRLSNDFKDHLKHAFRTLI